MVKHPAKFSKVILDNIDALVIKYNISGKILDPFAGVGKLADIIPHENLWLNEIEPEWLYQAPDDCNLVNGDALNMLFSNEFFDAIITSPSYGNRMADKHEAKDDSRRMTYKHTLGRELSPNNSGGLQWGKKYRQFHIDAWNESFRVLKHDGYFILNISNHIRKGKIIPVTGFHFQTLLDLGLRLVEKVDVSTPRMRMGENNSLRVDHESILVFKKE